MLEVVLWEDRSAQSPETFVKRPLRSRPRPFTGPYVLYLDGAREPLPVEAAERLVDTLGLRRIRLGDAGGFEVKSLGVTVEDPRGR